MKKNEGNVKTNDGPQKGNNNDPFQTPVAIQQLIN